MTAPVLFVVPDGIDDPLRVSGGNVYDRHVRDGLRGLGRQVTVAEAAGAEEAASAVRSGPDGTVVLVDGLVAGWMPDAVAAAAERSRVVVLAHMVRAVFPDADAAAVDAERRALGCADRVIVPSRWAAEELVRRRIVAQERVVVAAPGVEPAPAAEPASDADLLCVGVIAPHKGQDTLLEALERIPDTEWTCTIAGSSAPHPAFARRIARAAAAFDGRVALPGVLTGPRLDDAYRRSALLVAPSRVESAGMALGEARARALPVVGASVGGIPETLGSGGALLVRPGDPAALAAALDAWMTDPALRQRLRAEALAARAALPSWNATIATIADVLEQP